jgi:hypothetical protein
MMLLDCFPQKIDMLHLYPSTPIVAATRIERIVVEIHKVVASVNGIGLNHILNQRWQDK